MLKAIGFDLWETLITDTPALSRQQERLRLTRMEQVLAARGRGAEAAAIEGAYRGLWKRCHDLYWSADIDVDCRRQIVHFLEELQLDPAGFDEATLHDLEDAYATAAVEIPPAVVEGAGELLSALRSRGFSLGLISNTGRTPGYALRSILEAAGMAAHFDAMIFSNEHGACKPQRSIFAELRSRLAVRWDEMLFVGDNPYADVLGAQRCGIRAVLFDPPSRGTAVAPPVALDEEVVPHARITRLIDLIAIVDELAA